MKKIFKVLGAIVLVYLIIKIATRPVIIPKETDPTGKIRVQQEVQEEYEKYMKERGL